MARAVLFRDRRVRGGGAGRTGRRYRDPSVASRPTPRRGRTVGALVSLAVALVLGGCAELLPLREPPLSPADDLTLVNTREEAVQRFGPPHEIRSSDVGPVLVYRRATVVDVNPNRYYGEDRGNRLDQYERVLLYLDGEGRIVRRAIEPE